MTYKINIQKINQTIKQNDVLEPLAEAGKLEVEGQTFLFGNDAHVLKWLYGYL
jgi:hypothetical protein